METVKRILWIDDDINRFALKPYIDVFKERGYTIDGAENFDESLKILEQKNTYGCIIIDVSMPLGSLADSREAKSGLRTGMVVLKKMMDNPDLAEVKKVIFTIVDNAEARDYCDENDVPYLEKQEFLSTTFVDEIEKIISSSEE